MQKGKKKANTYVPSWERDGFISFSAEDVALNDAREKWDRENPEKAQLIHAMGRYVYETVQAENRKLEAQADHLCHHIFKITTKLHKKGEICMKKKTKDTWFCSKHKHQMMQQNIYRRMFLGDDSETEKEESKGSKGSNEESGRKRDKTADGSEESDNDGPISIKNKSTSEVKEEKSEKYRRRENEGEKGEKEKVAFKRKKQLRIKD